MNFGQLGKMLGISAQAVGLVLVGCGAVFLIVIVGCALVDILGG